MKRFTSTIRLHHHPPPPTSTTHLHHPPPPTPTTHFHHPPPPPSTAHLHHPPSPTSTTHLHRLSHRVKFRFLNMSRRGRGDPDIQGQRTGGWRSVGRAGGRERERERDLFLRGDRQEVAWRGKDSLHASTPLWMTHTDTHRTLDRAWASPGHHHLSLPTGTPIHHTAPVLDRVTGHDSRGHNSTPPPIWELRRPTREAPEAAPASRGTAHGTDLWLAGYSHSRRPPRSGDPPWTT